MTAPAGCAVPSRVKLNVAPTSASTPPRCLRDTDLGAPLVIAPRWTAGAGASSPSAATIVSARRVSRRRPRAATVLNASRPRTAITDDAGLETRAARVAVAETATRGVDVTRAMVAISIGRRRNVLCASMWTTRADSDGIFTPDVIHFFVVTDRFLAGGGCRPRSVGRGVFLSSPDTPHPFSVCVVYMCVNLQIDSGNINTKGSVASWRRTHIQR